MKKRQSNFEILRILAMFCIVMGHSMTHGTLLNTNNDLSNIKFILFRFLAYNGKIGVYLFILISGYFMIYSTISVKKIVKLWLPVFFWSVFLTTVVGQIIGQFSYKDFALSFIPIISNRYWFVSTYIFLYLLIPVINKVILFLSIKLEFLIILVGAATIFPSHYLYGSNVNSWLFSFCFTYFIGAIIRKRKLLQNEKNKMIGRVFLVIGVLCNFMSTIVITFARNSTPIFNKLSMFLQQETLFCLFIAVGLFVLLGSESVPYNRFINTIASTTFGIYLIHDNGYVGKLLWIDILHMNQLKYSTLQSILYVFICVIMIFMVCSLLEIIRKKVFGRLEISVLTHIEKMTDNFFES